jgi:hypothetical protein
MESEKVSEEIEITPEMIEAGGRVYMKEALWTWDERVSEIYRAMERARLLKR